MLSVEMGLKELASLKVYSHALSRLGSCIPSFIFLIDFTRSFEG